MQRRRRAETMMRRTMEPYHVCVLAKVVFCSLSVSTRAGRVARLTANRRVGPDRHKSSCTARDPTEL